MAEGEGFEPSKGCPLPPFQDGALGHYATPPHSEYYTDKMLIRGHMLVLYICISMNKMTKLI